MAEVYGNSHLTVIASTSSNAYGGLFYGPNRRYTRSFKIDSNFVERFRADIFVREILRAIHFVGFYPTLDDDIGPPVHKSA